jgi:hypothetical protein
VIWPGPIAVGREPTPETSLIDLQKVLASKKFVDLTHAFAPGIQRWSGFPDEQRKTIYRYDKQSSKMGDGFFAEIFTHVGQWGTHVACWQRLLEFGCDPSTVVENMLGQFDRKSRHERR